MDLFLLILAEKSRSVFGTKIRTRLSTKGLCFWDKSNRIFRRNVFHSLPYRLKTVRAAWDLEGSLDIVTPFVKSSVDFTVGAAAKIDFTTDVNFGDGLLACLRMGQEKFNIE